MPEPMTRQRIDALTCDGCGEDHNHEEMFFHSRCHPGAPTWAVYEDGVVVIKCADCDEVVVAIKVADE